LKEDAILDPLKPVFLQVTDDSEERVLHPVIISKIIGDEGYTYICELDRKEELSCEEDVAAFIYFEGARTFMQQSIRICSVTEAESKVEITIKTTSDPVSADCRECYRVSTVMLDLTVTVADEEDCPLLDVSASGMSATTTTPLKRGNEIPVRLSYGGQEYAGEVIVQNACERDTGRIRHGFHCVEDRRCGGDLQKGLQVVSTAVQRLLIQGKGRV